MYTDDNNKKCFLCTKSDMIGFRMIQFHIKVENDCIKL